MLYALTMQNISEYDVRRIVREEIEAALASRPAPRPSRALAPSLQDLYAAAVDRFVATLAPGEQVRAVALWRRFKAWAGEEAPDAAGMTATRFGKVAGRCGRLARDGGAGGHSYLVRAEGKVAPLAGAAPP